MIFSTTKDFVDEEEENDDNDEEEEKSEITTRSRMATLSVGSNTQYLTSVNTLKENDDKQVNVAVHEFKEAPLSSSTMEQKSKSTSKQLERQSSMLGMTGVIQINQNYFTVDGNNLEMIETPSLD